MDMAALVRLALGQSAPLSWPPRGGGHPRLESPLRPTDTRQVNIYTRPMGLVSDHLPSCHARTWNSHSRRGSGVSGGCSRFSIGPPPPSPPSCPCSSCTIDRAPTAGRVHHRGSEGAGARRSSRLTDEAHGSTRDRPSRTPRPRPSRRQSDDAAQPWFGSSVSAGAPGTPDRAGRSGRRCRTPSMTAWSPATSPVSHPVVAPHLGGGRDTRTPV